MRRRRPDLLVVRRIATPLVLVAALLAVAPQVASAAPAPAPASGLSASVSGTRIALTWTASPTAGVSIYQIYRGGTLLGSAYTIYGNQYYDTTVAPGATYTYYVVAIGSDSTVSVPSNSVTISAGSSSDTTPPTAPANVAATAGNGQVGLTWSPSSDAVGVSGYRVYRNGTLVASPFTAAFTDSGLTNGVSYSYTVRAIDAAGNLSASSVAVTATPVAGPLLDTTAPSAPASLTATAGNAQVALSWTAATDNVAVTGYRVYRNGTLVASPAGTTLTDTGLINGVSYSYTVRAIDAAGNLSAASPAAAATPTAAAGDTVAPSAPASLTATAGNTQVALSWTAATDNVAVTGYRVYRNGSLVASPAGTTFTDSGLANGTSYSYTVRAIDAAGNLSAASPAKSATPLASIGVAAPTNVAAAPNGARILITWTASTTSSVAIYQVYRGGTYLGSAYAIYGTQYYDTSVVGGSTYSYYVVSIDSNGNPSAPSASVTATLSGTPDTVAPSAPASLTATAGNTQVALSWTAATDNVAVTGYRVYRNGSLVASPAGTTFTDSGLANGTSYSYTVRAIDAAGNLSAASPAKSATPAGSTGSTGPTGSSSSAVVPFLASSPWNTPIGASPTVSPMSATYMNAISSNGQPLTSDPDQYTIPVYTFDDSTPRGNVQLREGYWQSYDQGDDVRGAHGWEPLIPGVPIPPAATQSLGSDGQIVMWNPATGEEWEFWQWRQGQSTNPSGIDSATGRGNYTTDPGLHVATNAIRYHTVDWSGTYRYYGRLNDGGGGRGAGTPYLAGLVRPWEIAQGRIDHALAFAYDSPAPSFVYPATKTDGAGVPGVDAPEGTRIQLDPSITDAQLTAWGLSPTAKIVARALQAYGMYVIDNSGSSKIYLEDRLTAKWDASVTRNLVSGIPWSAFRVVTPPAAP